jgi:hypothetical protein
MGRAKIGSKNIFNREKEKQATHGEHEAIKTGEAGNSVFL